MLRPSRWCWLCLIWSGLALAGDQETTLFSSEPVPQVTTAGSPAARLTAELGALKSLDANFTQITLAVDGRVLQQNEGHLWVASPASFRIETQAPFAQTLVSDGKDFWSYDADLAQVIIQPLDRDLEQVPILLLGGDSAAVVDSYDISTFEDEEQRYFVLKPRSQASLFETLTLAFHAGYPVAITINDATGQQTRISLGGARINQTIDATRFQFVLPSGVDVIDDRPPDS